MRHWFLTKDGDRSVLALYERHYSCYQYADGRERSQFVGPGEAIVLRTDRADAGFVWRRFIDDSGERGVNCAFFRNEGPLQSSELVRQADAIADFVWPGARHYTFVDPEAVRGTNPGFCFVAAGYRRARRLTASGKLIFFRPHCRGIAMSNAYIDISSEEYRVYSYADGSEYRINSPMQLHVIGEGEAVSHRIVTADGLTHRPTKGWVGLAWKPRPGAPAFVA